MRVPARAVFLAALLLRPGLAPAARAAPDTDPLTLALRGIGLTTADLSFQKTNAESICILPTTRQVLQHPLAFPPYAATILADLRAMQSLEQLSRLGGSLALPTAGAAESVGRARLPPSRAQSPRPPPVCPPDLESTAASISPRLAPIIRRLYQVSAIAADQLRAVTPPHAAEILAAWAIANLDLRRDPDELKNWAALGIDTAPARALLARIEKMDLQDGEIEAQILSPALNASGRVRVGPGRPGPRPSRNPVAAVQASPRDGAGLLPSPANVPFTQALSSMLPPLAAAVDDAVGELRRAIAEDPALQQPYQVECDTPLGKVILGGAGPNPYTHDTFLILDTGGDDRYENSAGGANGLIGRPVSIVIDCAGNDHYVSHRSFSQGAGLFGIGILVDLAGDDRYEAKHVAQGAGLYGAGILTDSGGQDEFTADTFVQGAGFFGAGILWQQGGHTTYQCRYLAQAFGGVQGCGFLLDTDGNDRYVAGGKYPCGWIPNHYFTLAQGFGQGLRPFAGGGVGLLADLHGNDHYQADVYGQGASYWYAIGLLLDAEGDDTYQAHQYCQGAGIHLSCGALIDQSGNDTYTASAICQGAAHDYSVGFLIDSAGDDRYTGNTTAQGTAINASFALLLDRTGNDSYTGTDPTQSQAAGHDGDKRECGSIALLLDLGGTDRYSQGQTNNTLWLKPWYGAGLDCEPVKQRNGETASGRSACSAPTSDALHSVEGRACRARAPLGQRPPGRVAPPALPPIRLADLSHPVERLLRRALRDPVTEAEATDAKAANDELKTRCLEVLPYILSRLDTPEVMIRVKAEELVDLASTNGVPALTGAIDRAANDEVARVCCYFLARFETATDAIPHVLPLLRRPKTIGTALYTLGHLRAQAAFRPALTGLRDPREMVRLRAAGALGRLGDRRAVPRLIAALDDRLFTVRYAAQDALVRIGPASLPALRRAFAAAPPRARHHLVTALAKLGDSNALTLADQLFRDDSPLLRAAVHAQLASLLETASHPHPTP